MLKKAKVNEGEQEATSSHKQAQEPYARANNGRAMDNGPESSIMQHGKIREFSNQK